MRENDFENMSYEEQSKTLFKLVRDTVYEKFPHKEDARRSLSGIKDLPAYDEDPREIIARKTFLDRFGHPINWPELDLRNPYHRLLRKVYITCEDEYEAFDALPAIIREFCREGSVSPDAREVFALFLLLKSQNVADREIVGIIRDKIEKLRLTIEMQTAAEMAKYAA